MTSNLPLSDVAPWSITNPETIIVGDTISSDGRFVLYTFTDQVLRTSSTASSTVLNNMYRTQPPSMMTTTTTKTIPKRTLSKVLWLGCSSSTEEQIALGLRKIGCTDQSLSHYISTTRSQQQQQQHQQHKEDDIDYESSLVIRSIPALMNSILLNGTNEFHEEEFLKKNIYKKLVKRWLSSSLQLNNTTVTPWIILDDVTALSNLLGDRLVYILIHSIRSLSSNFGLVLRYSIDKDYTITTTTVESVSSATTTTMSGSQSSSLYNNNNWFGAGGCGINNNNNNHDDEIPWERSLVELATLVIDVIPLSTGISREVHGRLLFTRPYDDGTDLNDTIIASGTNTSYGSTNTRRTSVYNYSLTDNKVVTIRIS